MGISSNYIGASGQVANAVVPNRCLGADIEIGGRQLWVPLKIDTVVQGTWAVTVNSANIFNVTAYNSSTAQNDEFTIQVYLSAGTYTVRTIGATGNTSGISTVSVDGVAVGGMDWYSAGGVGNVTKEITGVVIATNGLKTISFKVATKNASSSSYYYTPAATEFVRTA